jgi:hypothetical protein
MQILKAVAMIAVAVVIFFYHLCATRPKTGLTQMGVTRVLPISISPTLRFTRVFQGFYPAGPHFTRVLRFAPF